MKTVTMIFEYLSIKIGISSSQYVLRIILVRYLHKFILYDVNRYSLSM